MTRGSEANIAYVTLDHPDEVHAPPEPDGVTARTVLRGVLKHSGAELSAHQTIAEEQEQWSSIAQLAAEYETIAAVAQRDRWISLMRGCGLTDQQVGSVLGSDSFGSLTAELRRSEANGHDVNQLLPALVTQRSLEDADDMGAVLISRLRRAARTGRGKRASEPSYIVGLIPRANGAMSPEMSAALAQRQRLMESRAFALAVTAVAADETWVKQVGTLPATEAARTRWLVELSTVAAYRDRYSMAGRRPIGEPRTEAQKFDAVRARQAVRRGRRIADGGDAYSDGTARTARSSGRCIG